MSSNQATRSVSGRSTAFSLDDLLTEYEQQCVRSRAIVAEHDLDEMEAYVPPGMEALSLRWIVNHLIEETARHLGHIDLLREIADGVRGL